MQFFLSVHKVCLANDILVKRSYGIPKLRKQVCATPQRIVRLELSLDIQNIIEGGLTSRCKTLNTHRTEATTVNIKLSFVIG